ncbi:DNA-binding transcriptional LysR family regulator [Nocardia sp. GAS34]|uniref:LysR substrate-binding domain-containing protein n=1 Tax=unclassified Nocardia TaxID=2637762 RepID=UPI003D22E7B8
MAAYAGAREAVAELEGLVRGHLRLGMTASVSAFDLPGLLGAFHEKYPGVRITLSENASDATIEELRAGRLDLAFAGVGAGLPADLAAEIFADEPVVAVVAAHDAVREEITLEALCERDLICLPPGAGLRAAFDTACAAAGMRPRIVFEAGDPHMLARLAARGLGVAILPHAVAAAHSDQVVAVPIADADIRARIALIRLAETETSPAARVFARTAAAWVRTVLRT